MVAVEGAFLALPAPEQRALALIVALRRRASRTELARVLRSFGCAFGDKRPLTATTLLPTLQRWQSASLVSEQPVGTWGTDAHSEHPLASLLAKNGLLAEAASDVRQREPLSPYGIGAATILSRELFLALYLPEDPLFERASAASGPQTSKLLRPYVDAYGLAIPEDALVRAGSARANAYLDELLSDAIESLTPVGAGALAYARRADLAPDARASAAQYHALRGDPELALELLADANDPAALAAAAFVALTRGDLAEARRLACEAVEGTRTKSSKRIKGLMHPLWPWVTLLLVTDQSDPRAGALGSEQLALCTKKFKHDHVMVESLNVIASAVKSGRSRGDVPAYASYRDNGWQELVLANFALELLKPGASKLYRQVCAAMTREAEAGGFKWVVAALRGELALVAAEAPWQRALRSLEQALQSVSAAASEPERDQRLVWVLQNERGRPRITPRLQVQTHGRFSSGRAVSLKRLRDAAADDALLDRGDRAVLKHLMEHRNYGWGAPAIDFDDSAPLALVGHPRVFSDMECEQPLLVERGHVQLQVHAREDGGWLVQVEPEACVRRPVSAEFSGDGRVLLYALTPEQRTIVEQLPARGLELPPEARESAQRTLGKLVTLFPMHSSLELHAAEINEVQADPRIHVQLRRTQGGLRIALSVAPLPIATRLLPGEGNAIMLGAQGERTLRCTRDLLRERAEYARIREVLALTESVAVIPTLPECLELICTLQELGDQIVVEWPEADPLTIVAQPDLPQLQLRIGDEAGWLSADGELMVDETLALSFRALLTRAHERHGRFVTLDDGRFVALSGALQRSIETAEALARVERDRVTLHPLALMALAQLDDSQLALSPDVAARLVRARRASTLQPQVPTTFEATLRPYQVDGFTWLSRLASWNAGACLADDMGLGKTLQTLALLVERAAGGPALVVAPTSVCSNWADEARRFAPTLRVKRLGSADRERTLRALEPFDLLICSYGVLQQEREALAQLQFHTAVIDEAQAIKNAKTQRARAAFGLRADQRIALTGTPVENHLGELWSILNFVNPGLLGSESEFEERFARPIQRDGDRARAQLLRRLIAPFVLRRKKSEVLDELPEKTVITLRIEPSAEERALYRALREQALARVHASGQPAQARMQLFAELMRMRRAACHPGLVLTDGPAPPSSKLGALEELIVELRENGHRALIFSQFVDYLQLVRARLEALGVSFQYLDGSSTPAARSASVDAFQRGAGDVFLISLKAGGFGLNLTAADYVIHLDPWWNPAVEDQASDRAHRIGQTRPVTIYRLVMRGSIEEKILALHGTKRELADDVLAGESRGAFDVDQLLTLLAEAHAQ
jgi:superfamily II DNA or RNA helicase